MISLIDFTGVAHPISDYTEFHITHKEDGQDVMSFCLDIHHPQYHLLSEEMIIRTSENEYLIKKIDDDRIDCQLNFDFLKERTYYDYESETQSLLSVLSSHLPAGWTIEGGNQRTILRTIRAKACNDYDIVMECLKVYNVKYIWHILEKRLVVVAPELIQPTGEYVTTELNLISVSFKGQSTTFATRLYAYGKDGMTMEDAIVGGVRYGLRYVENKTYCDKTVCVTWVDDRYTIPESLYADSVDKLNGMAIPVRSYTGRVIDLARMDEQYSFLTFSMHRKLSLIDVDRGISVVHQIVEYDEWPDELERSTVTLSCVQDTIYTHIDSAIESTVYEIEQAVAGIDDKIEEGDSAVTAALSLRLNMATAMLTSAFGSHCYSENGELFMMDNPDPAQAQIVWRWNVNGFAKSSTGITGPYTTALTFDDTFVTGVVQAMIIRGDLIEANSISSGKIKQEYTDGVLSQSFTAAKGYVDALFTDLNTYLNGDEGQLTVLREDIANIEATIAGLSINFSEAFRGGINYVHNSAGLNGLSDDWTTTGTVVTMQSSDTKNYTVSNSCFRLSVDSSLQQVIDTVVLGEAYTISAKIKKEGSYVSRVYVIYNGNSEKDLFNSSTPAYGWKEYSATIEEMQSTSITIVCETRCDYLYVSDIMLCEGVTSKAWTPASDEIYTSGVKIDKRGITVYRSGTNEKTVISNEEFAGYNGETEIFSLNGDETRINNAIVRKQLRIEDAIFIPFESGQEKGLNIALID